MDFTNEELNTISNGLIMLIKNASEARVLVCGDTKSMYAIDMYIDNLKELNKKVCHTLDGK